MSYRNWDDMHPYLDEAKKILSEKFKFGSRDSEKIIFAVCEHFGEKPHVEGLKNPRRLLLSAIRKYAAKVRREQKAWTNQNKNQ